MNFQRRPFLTPVWLTVVGAAMAFGMVAFAAWEWGTAGSTLIIVVRHAEKELDGLDPKLTAAGEARADLLASMFGDAKASGRIDAIYTSPALRNRRTAAPLAARLGLAVIASADNPKALARRVLHEHGGGRVLIVGHSDSVPQIVAALSENIDVPAIAADEYGTMYIVTVPRIGHANYMRLNY